MTRILPAIIPVDAVSLHELSQAVCFAPTIQIDIVDGKFAQPASWPYDPNGDPSEAQDICERFEVQIDIMGVDPYEMASKWVLAGARELVIHLESVADIERFFSLRQKHGVALLLSGNDTIPIESFTKYQHDIDGVQLMGISTIGSQGQPQSPYVIDNITKLKSQCPTLPIQIDGNVNLNTIEELALAGATNFVVGSAIMAAADKRAAYSSLLEIVSK